MKALGLDLGNKTLGVAISDELGFLARPLTTIRFANQDLATAKTKLLDLIATHKVSHLVLGLPKNMDGSVGEQGQFALKFEAMLADATDVPITMWDERLTSKMASSMMKEQQLSKAKRRDAIDAMAATIILQGFLDRQQ